MGHRYVTGKDNNLSCSDSRFSKGQINGYFYSTEQGLQKNDNIKDVHEAFRDPNHGPACYCAVVDLSTSPYDTGDISKVKTGCDR